MDVDRPHGPYDTEAAARTGAAPLLAGLEEAGRADTDDAHRQAVSAYLTGILDRAGVQLGKYDAQVLRRLTMWEPEPVAVVGGWIMRAHADGCAEAEVNLAPADATSAGAAPVELEAEFPDTEA